MDVDPAPGASGYEERHSALNGSFLTWCLAVPAAAEITCLVLAITVNPAWLIAAAVLPAFLPFMVAVSYLYRNWPTGIGVGESGITIGAIGSRRAASRTPSAYHQAWGEYTCPWLSVHSARVVTDRRELRRLAKSPGHYTFTNRWGGKLDMQHCNVGVLSSPFMHAALVVDLYPGGVTGTAVRPGRMYTNFKDGRFSRLVPPQVSATWIAPTRNPEALSKALARQAKASGWADR